MRLFQNAGVYPAYYARRGRQPSAAATFTAQIALFLDDRYGAAHFLAPVLLGDKTAFFTNGDDEVLQRTWAREKGMPGKVSLADILLAQIESHCTEIFYNLDPMRYGSEFVRKLPGCVRKTIAWRAAPSPGADFGAYDRVVCNFPAMLKGYEARGWKAAYFAPAHDPVMNEYGRNEDRSIDVLFVGGYSRHHTTRAAVLEAVAGLGDHYRIEFCLNRSRLTRLAESPVGYLGLLGKYRRPRAIRAVSHEPVFGRGMYERISQSKIVLNGSIDMAGEERGNMRCFEALGCGALMISDAGIYPQGMEPGVTLKTYGGSADVVSIIESSLKSPQETKRIAARGFEMVGSTYSKAWQWTKFQELVGSL